MNRNDIHQIRNMIPCLLNIIERRMGYLVDTLEIYANPLGNKYSHFIKLAVLERNWDYDVALDTVGIYLYVGRGKNGIRYKFSNFIYSPSSEFKEGGYQMRDRIDTEFQYWWWSTECVITAKENVAKQLALYKEELIGRTMPKFAMTVQGFYQVP